MSGNGPVASRLSALVAAGKLDPDASQTAAAGALDRFLNRLENDEDAGGGFWPFAKKSAPEAPAVYLHGPVGRGKSMMMDFAYDLADAPKARLHFHEFMAEAHARVGAWRKLDDKARKNRPERMKGADLDDPIPHVARSWSRQVRFLAFDEFEVNDIADAMLLGRLFEALHAQGTAFVTTSNREPEALYKDGLNRELFLPFIRFLRAVATVVEVGGPRDYRAEKIQGRTYFRTGDGDAVLDIWDRLTCVECGKPETLTVGGRQVHVPKAWCHAAWFAFDDIAGKNLGARDYLAIVRRYDTVFLVGVPRLGAAKRDQAKRFATFIDTLYEARTKLVIEADAEPDDLYPSGDYAFEFARTASRLKEMRSKDYVSARRRTSGPNVVRNVARPFRADAA